jgi:GT2 family glycosyltransferase/glycosyltransferase involved in cell wall biosynthesis
MRNGAHQADTVAGRVSVVVVNYRGADDTIACLEGLSELDWPRDQLQVVVVDNASGDGSAERIAEAAPDVLLIRSEVNTGFAGGCNLGISHATGEFVALINSDARPAPEWLSAAVEELRRSSTVGAVASKVVDWDGTHIDFVGGSVNFTGQGYKLEAGLADNGQFDQPKDVLFFTGSAAVIRTAVFRELGGFDESFFMFFEDVDLGWRMNLRGYRVRYVPESLVYHKHHAAIAKFGEHREQYLLARNALMMIYKNFADETLANVLAPALMLTVFNSSRVGGVDTSVLDLERGGGDESPELTVAKTSLVGPYAIDFLTRNLPALSKKRREIQASRVRTDAFMTPLLGDLLQSTGPSLDVWNAVVDAFGLRERIPSRVRVLVITADTLAARMAGPAIRALHIAEELSNVCDVTLVSTTHCTLSGMEFRCLQADERKLRALVDETDVIVFQGFVMHHFPWIAESEKVVVVDIYDPIHLEQLEQSKSEEFDRRTELVASTTEVLNEQLQRGDFFLCASEEQRHFWLGQLAGLGRLNPANYDRDSSLGELLAIVPFGLSNTDPVSTRHAIKGTVPGIGADDKVILWGGGVYNWFDPLTVISAVDMLRHTHPDIRLFFLGLKHPNPNVPEMSVAWQAKSLADHLGLTDKYVFFNEDWVEYDDRVNYLLDADVGVSAHFLHAETTFSFRTRILDYLWAGMPVVATVGDAFGRLVASEGLGVAVGERDVTAMAEALERALYDADFIAASRANVARVRRDFAWSRVLQPLVDFCLTPRPAEDRRDEIENGPRREKRTGTIRRKLGSARLLYRNGGVSRVLQQASLRLRLWLRRQDVS